MNRSLLADWALVIGMFVAYVVAASIVGTALLDVLNAVKSCGGS